MDKARGEGAIRVFADKAQILKRCAGCRRMVWLDAEKIRCFSCGMKRAQQAAKNLHEHKGPFFDKWKANVRAAVNRM